VYFYGIQLSGREPSDLSHGLIKWNPFADVMDFRPNDISMIPSSPEAGLLLFIWSTHVKPGMESSKLRQLPARGFRRVLYLR